MEIGPTYQRVFYPLPVLILSNVWSNIVTSLTTSHHLSTSLTATHHLSHLQQTSNDHQQVVMTCWWVSLLPLPPCHLFDYLLPPCHLFNSPPHHLFNYHSLRHVLGPFFTIFFNIVINDLCYVHEIGRQSILLTAVNV